MLGQRELGVGHRGPCETARKRGITNVRATETGTSVSFRPCRTKKGGSIGVTR
jgi:hypothetical protein